MINGLPYRLRLYTQTGAMHTTFHRTCKEAVDPLDAATMNPGPTAGRYTGGGIDVWVDGPGWVIEDGEPEENEPGEADPNDEPDEETPRLYGRRPYPHRGY